MEMGLHIQHGGQRSSRGAAEYPVECVLYTDIPEAQEAMGGLAWVDCGVDCDGDELGAAGLSPMVGIR